MAGKHIGFFLDMAYGHIISTLGMASELLRRGHRVSYAITEQFAPLVQRYGANAVMFKPLDTRAEIYRRTARADGTVDSSADNAHFISVAEELSRLRTENSLAQLEILWRDSPPDVVIHDDSSDIAGRMLADKWGIPRIRHEGSMLSKRRLHRYAGSDDRLVIVSVPAFFNEDTELFGDRFVMAGFSEEGRRDLYVPWPSRTEKSSTILACATTGLVPQLEFCKRVIGAFGNSPWQVVLSIPSEFDPVSAIDLAALPELPRNVRLNRYSSNLEIMESACLLINQGGQQSTLEAVYSGVPILAVPLSAVHEVIASRVVTLGLGARLSFAEAVPDRLRECASAVVNDAAIRSRVSRMREAMRMDCATQVAADLIEQFARTGAASSSSAKA